MTDEVRTVPKDVHVDEVRDLVARGKEKGWLTADEIADALGALDLSAEQVDNVYALVAEEGIEVVDHEPISLGGTPVLACAGASRANAAKQTPTDANSTRG